MSDYRLPDRPQRERKSSTENLGEVALKTETYDAAGQSVSGVNIQTGEEMTIQLASREDFAKYYVDRDKYPREEDRLRRADTQLASRKDVGDMEGRSQNRDGTYTSRAGSVLQFQSVLSVEDGARNLARWAQSVTTDPQYEAAQRGYVQVHTHRDVEDRKGQMWTPRSATVLLVDQSEPASRNALEAMTANKVFDHMGDPLEGRIRSRVMVAVTDGEKTFEGVLSTPFDKERKRDIPGLDAFMDQPATRSNMVVMAALRGRLGFDVDGMRFATVPDETTDRQAGNRFRAAEVDEAREVARGIHAAAAAGQVGVSITPGVAGSVMKYQNERISDWQANNSPKTMTFATDRSGDRDRKQFRGFFEADVGFQSQPPRLDEETGEVVRPSEVQVMNIRHVGFMRSPADSEFERVDLPSLGEKAIAWAESRGDIRATPESSAEALRAPSEEPAASRETQDDPYASESLGMS